MPTKHHELQATLNEKGLAVSRLFPVGTIVITIAANIGFYIGLSPTGFAIYGLLEKSRPSQVAEQRASYDDANRDLASLIDEAIEPLTEYVDWHQKDDVQREMRRLIKRQLRATGMDRSGVDQLAVEIVDLAKVRRRR